MTEEGGPARSLRGIRVLDLSGNLAGPYCGQILADLGAEVVKVERPGAGDPARGWAPPAWGGDGTLFLAANRGKRSLALELGSEEGAQVLDRLLSRSDVAIQAFRPDVARRFGLTGEVLRARHPRLILCTLTAFDPEGPQGDRPGYDPLIQAHTGLISVTGPRGGPPSRVGTSLVDMGAGMWGALGILAALRSRDRDGRGCDVHISLEDVGLAWGAYHLMGVEASGQVPGPMGTGLGMIAPYGAFPTLHGAVILAVGTDELFRRCCEALGLEGVSEDPRFLHNADRVAHRTEVEEVVARATGKLERQEVERRMVAAGVPCAPVRDMGEVAADPAVREGAFRPEVHPAIPDYRAVAPPPRWDGERAPPGGPPPAVGAHSREILGELGYTPEAIRRLEEEGVVGAQRAAEP